MYCIGPSNGDFISKLVIKLNLNTSSIYIVLQAYSKNDPECVLLYRPRPIVQVQAYYII